MAQTVDDAQGRNITHANQATQAGFTMIPNAVMLRADIPPLAKLLYGYLKHLAWRGNDAPVDPSRELIADAIGLSVKQVTANIRALQKAPAREGDTSADAVMLIEAVRRGQGLTNLYLIHDPEGRKAETAEKESPDLPNPISRGKTELQEGSDAKNASPPAIVKIGGRNLPLDALMEVCGLDYADDAAVKEATTALNGRKLTRPRGNPDVKVSTKGITHLFWHEVGQYEERHPPGGLLARLHVEPSQYAEALARQIHTKASRYRMRMDGAILTPGALQKWWLRLEHMDGDEVALTPAEVRARGRRG